MIHLMILTLFILYCIYITLIYNYLITCLYEKYFFICRGLFISIHDRGHIATMLKSWPESVIKVSTSLVAQQS